MITKTSTQIRLPSGDMITLNEQQEEALESMKAWLEDSASLFFCLSGYAGTGKTTIVKVIIDDFLKEYKAYARPSKKSNTFPYTLKGVIEDPVSVSAPTNKAKNQIQMSTGLEGKTIQSLLGLSPNVNLENFNINKPEFGQLRKPTLEEHKLVVIDEASMFNADLFEMTVATAQTFGTKILFMCDEAQLPPVNEILSPVIDSELITSRYQLTKVERQQDTNPLMFVYDAIRGNLNSKVDPFRHVSNINDKGEGIEFLNNLSTFGGKVVTEFASKAAMDDPLHCKVLCWTNDRVYFWNKAVRAALYAHFLKLKPETTPEERILYKTLMPGDMLMAYTPSGELVVSTEYLVNTVSEEVQTIRYGSSRALAVDVDVYRVNMRNIQTKMYSTMLIIKHEQANLTKFMEAFNYFLDQAKFNRKWKDYFNFKDQYHLLQDIKTGQGKLLLRKDIDYSYALTVHKSQGSSYQKVFLDMPDINKNPTDLERNKLKYVALSRPRQAAIVLVN